NRRSGCRKRRYLFFVRYRCTHLSPQERIVSQCGVLLRCSSPYSPAPKPLPLPTLASSRPKTAAKQLSRGRSLQSSTRKQKRSTRTDIAGSSAYGWRKQSPSPTFDDKKGRSSFEIAAFSFFVRRVSPYERRRTCCHQGRGNNRHRRCRHADP